MNKIDKFFRDGMNKEQHFPFQEAHWEDALRLIEASEKQRKRRFGFLRWSLLLLVGVAVGAGFWQSNHGTVGTNSEKVAGNAKTTVSSYEDKAQSINEAKTAGAATVDTVSAHNTTTTTTTSLQQTANNTESKKVIPFQSTVDKKGNKGSKERKNADAATLLSVTGKNATSEIAVSTTKEINGTGYAASTATSTTILSEIATSATTRNEIRKAEPSLGVASSQNATSTGLSINDASEQNEKHLVANVALLPLLLPNLVATQTFAPKPQKVDCPVIPRFSPFWRFGLVADAYAPISQRTQFGGGVVVSRAFNTHWRAETGLQYQFLQGSLPNTKNASQVQYSFGKSINLYELKPNQIHRLMLPVSLQYTHGAHMIEFGGAAHYLAGVRGNLTSADSMGTINQRGWVPTDGLRKLNVGLFTGYRYRVAPGLVVGVRVHYLPNSLWHKDYVFESGYTPTFVDKWSGNLGVYYFFKQRK